MYTEVGLRCRNKCQKQCGFVQLLMFGPAMVVVEIHTSASQCIYSLHSGKLSPSAYKCVFSPPEDHTADNILRFN